ncbi:MAG: DUF362 domain-containing protein [Deltaproteobacteria bacterium]|nr:DUF362 domain-containing protein [Deltaproteobacteria bacterium]
MYDSRSKVFFLPADRMDEPNALARLLAPIQADMKLENTDLVAVKIHPGEEGNQYYVHADSVQAVIDGLGLDWRQTFVTDTTVLYRGRRMTAPDYAMLAREHGFGPPDTPSFIVADGLRGTDERTVLLPNGCSAPSARIARIFEDVDAMVVVSHFKGHLLAGFGGAIKNLGMGCASRGGKLFQHSTVTPTVHEDKCIACGVCADHCPENAIDIDEIARIDPDRCVGCGECLQRCPTGAMRVSWNQRTDAFVRRLAEYAWAATQLAPLAACVNFVTDVSADCDCMADAAPPMLADIGVLASTDPVALDQACLDLTIAATPPKGSPLAGKAGPGEDKFAALRPSTHGPVQLEHAEKLGLGRRDYVLHRINQK